MSNAYNYYSNRSNRNNSRGGVNVSTSQNDQEYLKELEQRRKNRLNQEQKRFSQEDEERSISRRKKVELEAKKKDEARSLITKLTSWTLQDVTNCGDPADVYDSEIDALEITPSLTFDEEDEHLGLNLASSKTFDWDEHEPEDSDRTSKATGFLSKKRENLREKKSSRALKDVSCNQRVVPQKKG